MITHRPFWWVGIIIAGGLWVGTAALGAGNRNPAPSLKDIVEASTIDSLTLSPDGRKLAFRVLHRSIDRNEVWQTWHGTELHTRDQIFVLGGRSSPIWMPLFDLPEDGVAVWTPDNSALLALNQRAGAIQVRRLTKDGDVDLTHDLADVTSFSIAPDGRRLTYTVGADRSEIDMANQFEERSGIYLDRTVITEGPRLTGNFRIGSRVTTIKRVSASRAAEPLGETKRQKTIPLDGDTREAAHPSALPNLWFIPYLQKEESFELKDGERGSRIRLRTVQAPTKTMSYATVQVEAVLSNGQIRQCNEDFCRDLSPALREVAIDRNTGEVIIIHEKDFSARSKVYGWDPSTGKSRLIIDPQGSLSGGSNYQISACPITGSQLLCVFSSPTRPQQLVKIDLRQGRKEVLFDPNTELATKAFGDARFMEWKDSGGRAANGVLLLPPGARKDLPLVITSYRCRGFLQGGSGQIAPEHILVTFGFATLCVNENNANGRSYDKNNEEIPLSPHKASVESYRSIVDILSKRGIIDKRRVGISGHSYSGMVAAYALSHTGIFKAGVIGTGLTTDPDAYPLIAPVRDSWRKTVYSAMGLPTPNKDAEGIWKQTSPALNANHIKAALLLQPPESEYPTALQLYTYIQDSGGIADMYIYPSSGHMMMSRPSQQCWRGRRSIDWFRYWLMPDTMAGGTFREWESDRRIGSDRLIGCSTAASTEH